MEEEDKVDFGFDKNKGCRSGGVDSGGNDDNDDDEEEEDETWRVLIVVVVVEEPARVDELNDWQESAMRILELNEDVVRGLMLNGF